MPRITYKSISNVAMVRTVDYSKNDKKSERSTFFKCLVDSNFFLFAWREYIYIFRFVRWYLSHLFRCCPLLSLFYRLSVQIFIAVYLRVSSYLFLIIYLLNVSSLFFFSLIGKLCQLFLTNSLTNNSFTSSSYLCDPLPYQSVYTSIFTSLFCLL